MLQTPSQRRPIISWIDAIGTVFGLFAVVFAGLIEIGGMALPDALAASVPWLGGATLACAALSIVKGERVGPGIQLFLLGAAAFAIQPFFWVAVMLLALWVLYKLSPY